MKSFSIQYSEAIKIRENLFNPSNLCSIKAKRFQEFQVLGIKKRENISAFSFFKFFIVRLFVVLQ